MPVPNKAISKANDLSCLFAPDSSSWSNIFFSIFLAATIAGWNVTLVGVLPLPSTTFSATGSSFFSSGPNLFSKSSKVSPGCSLVSSESNR